MKNTVPSLKNDIIDLAIDIALQTSWERVRLTDIAEALHINLNVIRQFFADKDQIIDACFDRADENMLQSCLKPEFHSLPTREKLQVLLMAWLGSFNGYQRVIRQMIGHKMEPGHLHLQLPAIKRISQTVQWWREAAGFTAVFPCRALEETGLTIIYLSTFAYWLFDHSSDGRATRRFLQKKLEQAGAIVQFLRCPYHEIP
ncbi:TetR/AcrR family transcriptional regulator [Legionella spiritensis]|uniref:TetR family transporter regulatory protein n=1 Tax=Legionella spiritensis TaxID=452 RepID=A0A0W0YWB1_LEGSP|nr:TetR/AcrR family transcriptional regulator [Legionella spiritensis]KTD61164.1 TetR family transporter regulatory protein [Legionella spiritensis]SNV45317.1 bacterial regulatory protein [Legionella spiritensis]